MRRYERNMGTLSIEENEKLSQFKICVIGCGGIGGYAIEMLGRLGFGYITVIDGDSFDESNLNRQILSDIKSLNKNKALQAVDRMSLVNPDIIVNPISLWLKEENAQEFLQGHNIIIDALDSIKTRFILQKSCKELNIPFIHGAVAGWYGHVTSIFPGDDTLNFLYKDNITKGIERNLGNPSFIPPLIASIQVSETLKIAIGRGEILRKKILFIDTFNQDYNIIDVKK